MDDVRTTANILCDLLAYVVKCEWSGQRNTACSCHPEEQACCPECNAFEYVPNSYREYQPEDRTHAAECALYALIKESRAFIRAENELREQDGRDYLYEP